MTGQFTFEQWTRWLRKLASGRLKAAAKRGLATGGQSLVREMKARTRKAPPASPNGGVGAVSTGQFLRGWVTTPLTNGVSIQNKTAYGPYIEGGRRPGGRQPPAAAIAAWAQRRLGLSAADAKRAAFVMARAIAKRGLRPRPILTGDTPRLQRLLLSAVRRELHTELSK